MACSTSLPNGSIPVLGSTRSNRVGVMHVPRGDVRERPTTLILELVAARPARLWRAGLMAPAECLQLALLIGRDHVLVRAQALAVEHAVAYKSSALPAFTAKSGSRW